MSFWAGVVQGVKDIDVLKEKEALADERQGVRDEATARYDESIAYRDRMQQLTDDRNALIEGRAAEAHGVAMATAQLNIGQKIAGLAGGTGGGNRTGTGGGTVPTPQAMEAGQRALQARIDGVGGLDDMSASQQTYYKSILGNVAASYELNNMLEAAVGEDKDLTVLTAVDRVRMVAVVAAQGQEAFAEFNRTAAEDGWDATEVAEAMQLAKQVNPAFAELVLMTPSKDNLTEQEQYKTLEQQLQLHAANWLNTNEKTTAFTTALSNFESSSETISSGGMSALIAMGVAQDWIHSSTPEGSLLRSISGPQVSAVPTVNADGTLVPVGGGTTPANAPSFTSAEFIALSPEEKANLSGSVVVVDGASMNWVDPATARPASLIERYGKDGLLPEGREGYVHPRDLAGFTGEAREVEKQRILRERATPVDLTERALGSVEGVTTAAETERERGAKRMGSGSDRASVAGMVAENAALNPPVNVESEAPAEPVAVEAIPAGQDLTPDQSAELKAGVEELIAAIFAKEDQGKLEVISRGLNARFTQERVGEAIRGSMGSNESEVLEEGAAKEAEETGPTRVTYRNAVFDVYPDGRIVSAGGQFKGAEVPTDAPEYEGLVNQANRIKARPAFLEGGVNPSDSIGTVGFQDLEPEQRERLEAGVKELFAIDASRTDYFGFQEETLTKALDAEFGPEVVKAALAAFTGSAESTDQ